MGFLHSGLGILARIFLSIGFLRSAIEHVINWKESEKQFMNVIADWQTYTVSSEWLQALFSGTAVWSPLILIIGTFFQILGVILLFFGIRERLGAFFLILVLVPETILVQHFWFAETSIRDQQFSFFLSNLAILGGLLIVMLRGTKGDGIMIDEFDKDSNFG